jgi:hypothetical protein
MSGLSYSSGFNDLSGISPGTALSTTFTLREFVKSLEVAGKTATITKP